MDEGWQEKTQSYHTEGDMIDLLLLNPAKFREKYLYQPIETPSSPNQRKFSRLVAEGVALGAAYDQSYSTNFKEDTNRRKGQELYNELEVYIDFVRKNMDEMDKKETYGPSMQEMLMGIQKNVLAHPVANRLLEKGEDHVVIQDQLLGEDFKCEVDLYVDLGQTVWNIDLKSTGKPLSSFPYHYETAYGYKRQQAIYYKLIRKKLEKEGRTGVKIRTGCLAVSKNYPYTVRFYEVHPRLLVSGWQWTREAVEIYKFHKNHEKGFTHPRRTLEKGMELLTPFSMDDAAILSDA